MRAPRPSDLLWLAMFAFAIVAFRMIFAADFQPLCPEGSGCEEAFKRSLDAAAGVVP